MTMPAEETQGLARFEGAHFYARTIGFCAVFTPGPVTVGDEWTAHPAHDNTFTADGAPELIVSRPDCRLVLGRCGRKLDMKRILQLSSAALQAASPVAVRVAPLAVALPLRGDLPFELPRRGLRCLPVPIRAHEPARYGNVTLHTHVTCSRGRRGGPLQLWLETSLIDAPDRHLHFAGDLRRLLAVRQGDVPGLLATMVDEIVQTEQALDGLEVDAAVRSQRRRLGAARVALEGVTVDVRLPSPGRLPLRSEAMVLAATAGATQADLCFSVLNGRVVPGRRPPLAADGYAARRYRK